jgi:hypothetical protein
MSITNNGNLCILVPTYTADQSKFLVPKKIMKIKKKGDSKKEGSEGLSLKIRTHLTKFSSHKSRESFTMQNNNNLLSRGQDAKGIRSCSKKWGHTCLKS